MEGEGTRRERQVAQVPPTTAIIETFKTFKSNETLPTLIPIF